MLHRPWPQSRLSRTVLAALVPVLAMTACSGGSAPISSTPPVSGQQSAMLQPALALRSALHLPAKRPVISSIFVADFGAFGNIKSFDGTGQLLNQSNNIDGPQNIVADERGNVYVANFGGDQIDFYSKNLKQKPTVIHLTDGAVGLAVGAGPNGKVFATLYQSGTVVAFKHDGTPTTPTIPGPGNITYVAVDAKGKIYVTDFVTNTLRTYKPDGTPTTPTITTGLNEPVAVVVDSAGKIYVTNSPQSGSGYISTYKPNGTQTTPTIPVTSPHGIAVAGNGNIYVTDAIDKEALTFKANGTPTTPTITGFTSPTGIAVLDTP